MIYIHSLFFVLGICLSFVLMFNLRDANAFEMYIKILGLHI